MTRSTIHIDRTNTNLPFSGKLGEAVQFAITAVAAAELGLFEGIPELTLSGLLTLGFTLLRFMGDR